MQLGFPFHFLKSTDDFQPHNYSKLLLPYFQVLHDIGPDTLVILLESFHIRLDLLFVALSRLIILDIILDIV